MRYDMVLAAVVAASVLDSMLTGGSPIAKFCFGAIAAEASVVADLNYAAVMSLTLWSFSWVEELLATG